MDERHESCQEGQQSTSRGQQQWVARGACLAKEAGEAAGRGQGLQHASSRQGLPRGLARGPGRADVGVGGEEVGQRCQLLLQCPPVQLRPADGRQREQLYACMWGWHLHGRIHTMRFESTAKLLAKCKLKYYRISE